MLRGVSLEMCGNVILKVDKSPVHSVTWAKRRSLYVDYNGVLKFAVPNLRTFIRPSVLLKIGLV